MVRAKNAGSDCCHCGECAILEDSFTRGDSTDIGSNWVELSGDPEILSNELRFDATGLIHSVTTWNKTRRVANVTARDAQPGKTYRLLFSVSLDGSSYAYVELECLAANEGWIRLGSSGGGLIEEFEFVYNEGQDYTLIACVNDEGTYGGLAEVSWPLWTCETFPGPRAGIQNVGSAAEFDDFGWYKHLHDTDGEDLRCHRCSCECDGKCVPRGLTLTLESTCAHRDGLTIGLTLDTSFYPAFVWVGEATWPDPLTPESTTDYEFRLFCSRSAGVDTVCADGEFALCAPQFIGSCSSDDWGSDFSGLCPDLGIQGRCSDSAECDPIEVRFGPGTCTGSPPPDPPPSCTETIVITA